MADMKEFAEKSGVEIKVEEGTKEGIPEDFKESDPWTVTLTKGKEVLSIPFYTGVGLRELNPKKFYREFARPVKDADRYALQMGKLDSYRDRITDKVPPTLETILDCLGSDASSWENARDFEDFANELGYDTDSRKAEQIYKQIGENAKRLKFLLGEDLYKELLWDTERL
jgi:hypothetical protein